MNPTDTAPQVRLIPDLITQKEELPQAAALLKIIFSSS
jgi:hypothetical protein